MNKEKNKKECYFCVNNFKEIDYKDIRTIKQFINSYKKILPRKKTKTCLWHQRKLASAIKKARIIALLPFTNK